MFSGDWVSADIKKSSLERLLIMPQEKTYVTDENGDAYLFYLQNYKPELLVNAPGTEIKYDSEGNVDESSLTKVSEIELTNLSDSTRDEIIKKVLKSEVKGVYNKAAKFDSAGGNPSVNGKALIAIVDPDENPSEVWSGDYAFYPSKRDWPEDSLIKILTSGDVDGKIDTPALSGDYDTFIYVYPVYSYYGSYTAGTTGYTQTYYAQVFDLKNKKAYPAQKIKSDNPPDTIYYYSGSSPQTMASGKVSYDTLIKFLKKL